jgi:hypothetical protein
MKTCLTCKYEPSWGKPSSDGVRQGNCKWPQDMPLAYYVTKRPIHRFPDDSGIYVNCPTWEEK